MHARLQKRRQATVSLALLLAALAPSGWPLAAEPSLNPAAARRTAVVEVFERWSGSVVFLAGPMFKVRNPSLEEFFNVPGEPSPQSSVGSGFIVHESGYVVVNAHAAEKVIYPEVSLSDGRTYRAELVASAHEEDVALVKIDAGRPLAPVKLAKSGDLLIGETVIVIAHPHGLRHTCTAGVISAVGRSSKILDIQDLTLHNLIQTDAGINPGSSGGPWFNVLGEVIGLTASKQQDADNIGFAIAAETIRRLLPEMLDVHRRYGLASGLAVAADGSCRVTAVEPDSPGVHASIRPDDVLKVVGGRATPTALDFHLALVGRKPHETLDVVLDRQGESVETSLVLGQRPEPNTEALLREKLGLAAAPLAQKTADAMRLLLPYGVVLTAVDADRYNAIEHKPLPGDVLARVGRIRPRDMEHLGLILERVAPGESVRLVVLRVQGKTATRIDIQLAVPK